MLKIKNYGLKLGSSNVSDYQWGKLPKVVINPSGDWTPSLPLYEPQILPSGEDEQGCYIWGTLNAIETILKGSNFSERFVFNGIEADNNGGDPFDVGEFIRHFGLIDDSVLPIGQTYKELCTPRPLSEFLIERAKLFLCKYEVKQEYVWNDFDKVTSLEEKKKRIKECLPLGPLGISVFAWVKDDNGLYYRPAGAPDTHWCVLFKENVDSYNIFDSYDQSIKKVRKDMNFAVCIRYQIIKKNMGQNNVQSNPQLSSITWWSKLLTWLLNFYELKF